MDLRLRPYGYTVDPGTGHLVVKPTEAPLVEVMYDRYTVQRHGAQAIPTYLNGRGHRTKAGKPWSHASVLTVLRNRAH